MLTDIELRPLAVAMLQHPDYKEEPKHALIESFRRMRRERNAAYEERDAVYSQLKRAQTRIIELELLVATAKKDAAKSHTHILRLGIFSAVVFVAFFLR